MIEEQESELNKILTEKGVHHFQIYRREVYIEPIVVFFDCLMTPQNSPCSIAFAFNLYPKLSRKFWSTYPKIKGSQPCPDYKILTIENKIFHPFSIDIENYSLDNILKLIDIIGANFE